MYLLALPLLLLAPSLVSARTISIAVGQGGLKFTPSIVTAAVGDKLDFHFYPQNHSVVASSFSRPCVPVQADGGLFSGFMSTNTTDEGQTKVFEVTVNSTDPIWIYCSQGRHCEGGMSMVVNQPSGSNSLAAYQAAARSVTAASSPAHIAGGVFIQNNNATANNGTSSSGGGGNGTAPSSAAPTATPTGTAVTATPTPGAAGRKTAVGLLGMMGAAVFVGAFGAGIV